jgi:hypothetical protein
MKLDLYYHWNQYDWEDEGKIVVYMSDISEFSPDSILLKVIEVEIPDVQAPSRELVMKHKVAKLQEEKKALQADTHIKLQQIEDKINQLQSLEYKS